MCRVIIDFVADIPCPSYVHLKSIEVRVIFFLCSEASRLSKTYIIKVRAVLGYSKFSLSLFLSYFPGIERDRIKMPYKSVC